LDAGSSQSGRQTRIAVLDLIIPDSYSHGLAATTKQNITEIYRGVIPFVLSQLVILAVLVGVPALSLVLVNMMS
jgi:TRAP-type mannitol/chloroaromatic compound transport system permease large subunit